MLGFSAEGGETQLTAALLWVVWKFGLFYAYCSEKN